MAEINSRPGKYLSMWKGSHLLDDSIERLEFINSLKYAENEEQLCNSYWRRRKGRREGWKEETSEVSLLDDGGGGGFDNYIPRYITIISCDIFMNQSTCLRKSIKPLSPLLPPLPSPCLPSIPPLANSPIPSSTTNTRSILLCAPPSFSFPDPFHRSRWSSQHFPHRYLIDFLSSPLPLSSFSLTFESGSKPRF